MKEGMRTIYLIGDKNSPKTNQWLQMTADRPSFDAALVAAGEGATFKTVEVSKTPSRKKQRKKQ